MLSGRSFLLEYLGDVELRRTINAVTNKSESFNDFTKWIAFGGDGTNRENDRDKQWKLIKFNHLVANCLILHNVQSMSHILHKLAEAGHQMEDEFLSGLSPKGWPDENVLAVFFRYPKPLANSWYTCLEAVSC